MYPSLVVVIMLIGCQSSANYSFHSLNQAFISWYYKFHPVEATRFGMVNYHENFRSIGISANEEYVADISRFTIELSQIDPTKLSAEARIDYYILYSQLEKMRYIMNDIRPWEWNPLWILDEINEGLFLLSERNDINMDDRVEAVKGRLISIPEMLYRSKKIMISHSPLHFKYGNKRVDGILRLINELPIKLNSDNLTLDEIDESILICKEAMLDYQKWLNQNSVNMLVLNFPSDLKLLDKAFPYFIGEIYQHNHVYKLAEKKLIPAQNRIFNLALPIYLAANDEPVWLDRDDTLDVIHWTIDHIRNKPENQVPISDILSHFYDSISSLEKFTDSNGIIPKNVHKRIELAFAPAFIQLAYPVYLFDHHPKKFNSEILYYIKDYEDSGGLFPLISHEIDLTNAQHIIPGRSIQIAYAQKYSSPIRYMFPDPINEAGWKIYAVQMILNKEYGDWNNEYHILNLKEEVTVICQAIIEGKYYSGEMERPDALLYIRKYAFLNDSEAEDNMVQSDLHYFSGTQAFIGMMEINSLLKEYKKKEGDQFQIIQFHKEILESGIIPFNQLKKQILSL